MRRRVNYAALDVWHLPALRDILKRELKKLGRLDWLEQRDRRYKIINRVQLERRAR